MSSGRRPEFARAIATALSRRETVVLLVIGYCAYGIVAVLRNTHLHDEGLLTYTFARATAADPMAMFFFQKARPVASTLLAPLTVFGPVPFLLFHVLVAASVFPLLYSLARRMDMALPALPPLLVALSPVYLAAGPAGANNVLGVVGATAFLWLVFGRRFAAAAALLGCLIWVRYELALLALVYVPYLIFVQRVGWRVLWIAAFPVAYAMLGALYHGDALWMAQFPPSLPGGLPSALQHHELFELSDDAIIVVLPLVCLPLFLQSAGAKYGGLALFATVFLASITALPFVGVVHTDHSPRYLLQFLPFAALLVTRVAEGWRLRVPRDIIAGAAAAAVVLLAVVSTRTGTWMPLAVTSICAGALALAAIGRWGVATVGLLGFSAAAPLVSMPATGLHLAASSPHVERIAAWLRTLPAEHRSVPVYTNVQVLPLFADGVDGLEQTDFRYIMQADQMYELTRLSNEGNGQSQRVRAAVRGSLPWKLVIGNELTPQTIPEGSLFVLERDERLAKVLPPALWDPSLSELHSTQRFRIARFGSPIPTPPQQVQQAPSANEPTGAFVIPPGQESLMANMFGGKLEGVESCSFEGATAQRDHLVVVYECGEPRKVALLLYHVQLALPGDVRTDQFAVRSRGAAPAALVEAVAERVRAHEATWRWRRAGATGASDGVSAGAPPGRVEKRERKPRPRLFALGVLGIGALVLLARMVDHRRRTREGRAA